MSQPSLFSRFHLSGAAFPTCLVIIVHRIFVFLGNPGIIAEGLSRVRYYTMYKNSEVKASDRQML